MLRLEGPAYRRTVQACRLGRPTMAHGSGSRHQQPFVLGLTGSVGMGKSTVASMFKRYSVPVLDADEVVHQLYVEGGAAVPAVRALFPSAVVNNAVDRAALGRCVLGDRAALARLEDAVHPLVAASRAQFLSEQAAAGRALVVLDIPLLYEKGLESEVDAVAVVSAGAEEQRRRVLARGWSEEKLDSIRALQVPDAEKRSRANHIIDTSLSLEATEAVVRDLINQYASGSC